MLNSTHGLYCHLVIVDHWINSPSSLQHSKNTQNTAINMESTLFMPLYMNKCIRTKVALYSGGIDRMHRMFKLW